MIRPRVIRVMGILSLSLLPSAAWAQTAQGGSIAGVVKDLTGAVLPGVTVEAASPALIEKNRTVITDGQGQYKIIDLRPGTYSVTFSLTGFTTVKREGIELSAGFTAPANADLRVGSVEETVTVTGASPIVDTQNVRSQNVLTRSRLDALPTGQMIAGFAALTLGAVGGSGAAQDVGGSSGELGDIAIHGGRGADSRLQLNGMPFNNSLGTAGGGLHTFYVNQSTVAEVSLETGGISAETETGGVQVNVVPKDGGNTFNLSAQTAFTNTSLQRSNLSDDLRARGLTLSSTVKKIYDFGGALGGPIKRDRLWFFAAQRWWGNQVYAPNNFFNLTQGTLFYTPDLSRRAYTDSHQRDTSLRLTWQAAKKHTFTVTQGWQDNCQCYQSVNGSSVSPEAALSANISPVVLVQSTWNYVTTSRLLLQAGHSYGYNGFTAPRNEGVSATDVPIVEQSTSYSYGARSGGRFYQYDHAPANQQSGRFSASYITGSHALKAGLFLQHGFAVQNGAMNSVPGLGPVSYQFRKATPTAAPTTVSVTYWASPQYSRSDFSNLGLYAQDQWTIGKMTLNMGLRWDYFRGWVPEQTRPGGQFVPEFHVAKVDNVPNWKNFSPRLGAAYDLFGNGKTAVKGSLGLYQTGAGTSLASANNPSNAIVTSASRNWNDANGDYFPQASELGPLAPSTFGTPVITTRYSPDVLTGNRGYSWQGAVSLQQELLQNVGLTVGYFRTWYGNQTVTDNTLVAPADFEQYCVTTPTDSRLPDGGGGAPICGLFIVSREKLPLTSNLVTLASAFGEATEVYNGFDVSVNARLRNGMLSAGVSTGQTVTDNCYVVDSPQQRFCRVTVPFGSQTQFKLSGAYRLPWAVQASAVFQNLAGIPILANRSFTNAEIAPSLGHNLPSCPAATGACTATAVVALIEPNTVSEDRLTQIDVRIAKLFMRGRVRGMIDIYNLLNASPILSRNNTLGPTWGQPTSILLGRMFKFGAQIEF